jgi:hypothetical protein
MAKPIHETLRHLAGGTFLDEAGDKLAELVAAVDSTGKAGTITLKISVKKSTKSAMQVVGNITMSKPQEAPDATLMFPTPEGNLLLNDPRQQNLELKAVTTQTPSELKQVGVK